MAALLAKQLLSITLATAVASVISVAQLMKRYAAGKKRSDRLAVLGGCKQLPQVLA